MRLKEPIALAGLCRTPVGKVSGMLAPVEPYKLLSHVFRATLERTGNVRPDDVIVGNVRNSIGNIARVGALDAGVPEDVPAQTVDRQCASSLEALAQAAARINAGLGDVFLAGGVESASRCPWLFEKTTRPYAYFEPEPLTVRLSTPEVGDPPMGETAEILADEFSIEREAMDAFAAESHEKAEKATLDGRFKHEIVPFPNQSRKAGPEILDRDECIRPDTTSEVLARLRPVFRRDGRVTAGNSSPLNDGAASCMALSRAAVERLGIEPDAWLTGVTTVALDPKRMGLGPAIAIPRALEEQGLKLPDIGLIEINEAFAAQVLAVLKHLENAGTSIPCGKLNVHGGAIALGHPLGATGLRLVTTMVNALKTHGEKRGLVSLCVGGGQGMAAIIETDMG